jgi:AAA family ATP:ADP antiporter
MPVVESVLLEALSQEQIKKLDLIVYSETECYHALLTRKDVKLKLAVLYLMEKTNNARFVPLLELALLDRNEKIHNKAAELLGPLA